MLKKITVILITTLLVFFMLNTSYSVGNCTMTWGIDACLQNSYLVTPEGNLKIEDWFKKVLQDWVINIAWFLWLVAIWAIVWGSFMMVISIWEEEKVKKAKDMIKWAIFWFLWIVLASFLITLVINFMYGLW